MARKNTKELMVASAIRILRERGVHGLTLDAVLVDSGAPRGSVYHHFPGGRQELLWVAAETSTSYISHLLTEATASGDPMQALDTFASFWREALVASNFQAGCPVAALATGDESQPELALARDGFRSWNADLATALVASGADPAGADAMAALTISAIEGAITICRAYRSAEPLDTCVAQLRTLFAAAVA